MSNFRNKPKFSMERVLAPVILLGYTVSATFDRIFVELSVGIATAISIFMIVTIYFIDRKLRQRSLRNKSFMVKAQRPQGAKGLIILLSPFSSFSKELAKETISQNIKAILNSPIESLTEEMFQQLDLQHSNLRPALEAVAYHFEAGELRDVWLFTTPDETFKGKEVYRQGSFETGRLLESYLKVIYTGKLHLHLEGFCIPSRDYEGLFIKAEEIFNSSGFKDKVMIADITGGNKMMSVALAMACTAPNRKMQYMDSERNWQGEPLPNGIMRPVLVDVTPMFEPS